MEVLSRSSAEDAEVETDRRLKSLQEDFDRRLQAKEEENQVKVKRLIKEYETEKHDLEHKHEVCGGWMRQERILLLLMRTSFVS